MLSYIYIGFHFFALFLSIPMFLKLTGYVTTDACPKCNGKVRVIKKRRIDKLIHLATFLILLSQKKAVSVALFLITSPLISPMAYTTLLIKTPPSAPNSPSPSLMALIPVFKITTAITSSSLKTATTSSDALVTTTQLYPTARKLSKLHSIHKLVRSPSHPLRISNTQASKNLALAIS